MFQCFRFSYISSIYLILKQVTMGNILATCCRTEEADEKNKEISQKGEVPISRNLIKDTEKSPILKREVEGISYTFYLFSCG